MVCHTSWEAEGFRYTVDLKICHVDLNSVINKLNCITNLLDSFNIDILGISESWLTPSIPSSFISISHYDFIRSDSPDSVKKHGVLVYIKK